MTTVKLNDPSAFELVSGLWKSDRLPLTKGRVLRSTNFNGDGLLDFSDVVELEVEERHAAKRQLKDGDIIIERSGGGPKQPVGRVAFFKAPDEQAYFSSNFTTTLRIRDQKLLDSEFVSLYLHALYLNGDTETLQRATTGIRNLDWQGYLNFEVPKLDMQYQLAVRTLISKVRQAYQCEQSLLTVQKELKQQVMQKLFTCGARNEDQKETEIGLIPKSWNVVSFSFVREWLQYGTSTKCDVKVGTYPVLRIPNIGSGRVIPSDLKYCDLSSTEAKKYVLQQGDLIFIRTNGVLERLGSCAVYNGTPENSLFASYLIRARLKPIVDPRFIAHFYGSALGTSLVAGRATPASDGKYNLNTGTIDALPLPLPAHIEEQRDIADVLDALDQKIELHKQKQSVLDEIFRSLLNKLMAGELSVDDLDLSVLTPDETQPQIEAEVQS